jgi:hypothetical protein
MKRIAIIAIFAIVAIGVGYAILSIDLAALARAVHGG